jgi:hypothetical protein
MTFKLEADGVHFWCSSPAVTRKLVEKGARLVDETQVEHLRRVIESAAVGEEARKEPRRPGH